MERVIDWEVLQSTAPGISAPERMDPGVAAIEARLQTEIRVAVLTPFDPRFTVGGSAPNSTQSEIQRELARLKGLWESAHRLKELSRLQSAVAHLKLLIDRYPECSVFSFNMGCIRLALDQRSEAMVAFAAAAFRDDDAQAYLNLAAAALPEHSAISCHALHSFFCTQCGFRKF